MVTTIITAMAAYSNERVAAIVLRVLYRMLTNKSQQGLILADDSLDKYKPIEQWQ